MKSTAASKPAMPAPDASPKRQAVLGAALGNALFRQCGSALADALWGDFPATTGLRALRRGLAPPDGFAEAQPLMLSFCELHHHQSCLEDSRAVEQLIMAPAIELLQRGQSASPARVVTPDQGDSI